MSEDGLDDVGLDAAGHRMTPERVSQPVRRGPCEGLGFLKRQRPVRPVVTGVAVA